jgi:hypothetical protein
VVAVVAAGDNPFRFCCLRWRALGEERFRTWARKLRDLALALAPFAAHAQYVPPAPVGPPAVESWVPGHWVWDWTQWEWAPGQYRIETPPAPLPPQRWVPGHSEWTGYTWQYVTGHWQ